MRCKRDATPVGAGCGRFFPVERGARRIGAPAVVHFFFAFFFFGLHNCFNGRWKLDSVSRRFSGSAVMCSTIFASMQQRSEHVQSMRLARKSFPCWCFEPPCDGPCLFDCHGLTVLLTRREMSMAECVLIVMEIKCQQDPVFCKTGWLPIEEGVSRIEKKSSVTR